MGRAGRRTAAGRRRGRGGGRRGRDRGGGARHDCAVFRDRSGRCRFRHAGQCRASWRPAGRGTDRARRRCTDRAGCVRAGRTAGLRIGDRCWRAGDVRRPRAGCNARQPRRSSCAGVARGQREAAQRCSACRADVRCRAGVHARARCGDRSRALGRLCRSAGRRFVRCAVVGCNRRSGGDCGRVATIRRNRAAGR